MQEWLSYIEIQSPQRFLFILFYYNNPFWKFYRKLKVFLFSLILIGSSATETTGSLRLRPRGGGRTLFSQRGHHHPHRQADQRLVARHGGRTHRHAPSSVCEGLIIWNTIFSRSSIINSSMIEFGKKETNMTVMIVIDRWRYLCGAVNTESVCFEQRPYERTVDLVADRFNPMAAMPWMNSAKLLSCGNKRVWKDVFPYFVELQWCQWSYTLTMFDMPIWTVQKCYMYLMCSLFTCIINHA